MFISMISCQSGKPIKRLSNDGFMYAMIYDHENVPVSGVTVYINSSRKAESDIHGRIILESIKKGRYAIKLTKKGYEELVEVFQYEPMNVLYFKMINTRQLTVLAEYAIDNGDYIEAQEYINRALAIEPLRQDILFLKSINYYLQGNYTNALEILENQLQQDNNNTSVSRLITLIKNK